MVKTKPAWLCFAFITWNLTKNARIRAELKIPFWNMHMTWRGLMCVIVFVSVWMVSVQRYFIPVWCNDNPEEDSTPPTTDWQEWHWGHTGILGYLRLHLCCLVLMPNSNLLPVSTFKSDLNLIPAFTFNFHLRQPVYEGLATNAEKEENKETEVIKWSHMEGTITPIHCGQQGNYMSFKPSSFITLLLFLS